MFDILSQKERSIMNKTIREFFDSKDYLGMALTFGEDLIPMSKNGTNYKIESEIPADCEQVTIYGSKNGRNYEGLIYYDVEN